MKSSESLPPPPTKPLINMRDLLREVLRRQLSISKSHELSSLLRAGFNLFYKFAFITYWKFRLVYSASSDSVGVSRSPHCIRYRLPRRDPTTGLTQRGGRGRVTHPKIAFSAHHVLVYICAESVVIIGSDKRYEPRNVHLLTKINRWTVQL